MTDRDNLEDTRQVDELGDQAALRGVVNPLKTQLEMTQGNLRMREHAVYNGEIKVAQATQINIGDSECVWMYLHAESRDGMDITLNANQARQLRDLLDEVLELQGEKE